MTQALALSPLLVLALGVVTGLLVTAARRGTQRTSAVAHLALLGALAALPVALAQGPVDAGVLLRVDNYALFCTGLLVAAGLGVAAMCRGYVQRRRLPPDEIYLLLLLSTFGACVLVTASHFASLVLGLETLSVSLYGLIAYARQARAGIEAAFKYLVLAGAASAFLLFGGALTLTELGTLSLPALATALSAGPLPPLMAPAALMMVVGVGFKLSVVPFHLWTPDVYQGAPAPISGLLATVSKGAVIALLVRWFAGLDPDTTVFLVLATLAGLTMVAGNLLALTQQSLKRLLAYSSIAHVGYLMVAWLAGGERAPDAVLFYLLSYIPAVLVAFGAIAARTDGAEPDDLETWRGLFWRRPALAGALMLALLSLAGIPVTAGFMAKLHVLAAGVDGAIWALVLTMVAGSVIGLTYYLRAALTLLRPTRHDSLAVPRVPLATVVTLAVLAALLLVVGLFPEPARRLIHAATLPTG